MEFKKVKTLKLSDYISIRKEEYVTFQLIPTKSNKNNSTDDIATLVNTMFIKANELIRKENNKLIIQTNMKASYYIHISKLCIQFYFIIPKIHKMKFKTKFKEAWKHIEIKEVDDIPIDIDKCTKYQLQYVKNDILSLDVDKRNNDLLNANMAIIDILEENDSVGVFYNFIPTGERENLFFKKKYKDNIQRYKDGHNLKKTKNIVDVGVELLKFIIGYTEDFLSSISTQKTRREIFIAARKDISNSTKRKNNNDICKTQVIVLTQSIDSKREKDLAISTCNSFKTITDDNEFRYKVINKTIDIKRSVIPNVAINKTTTEECQNFIALPGRELIEQYNIIEHNKIIDNPVPQCLQNGNMLIGTVNYKEQVYNAYFSMHEEFKNLERVLIGSKGSGKSYKMMKLAQDAISIGNGVVLIDIIGDCKLSKSIAEKTPKDKLLRIQCNNFEDIQAYVYNEIQIDSSMKPYQIVSNAIQRTQQLQVLIDAINEDSSKLSTRMIKFLFAAGAVVYSAKHNASLSDLLECLEFHEVRHNFIEILNPDLVPLLQKRINKLLELDDIDKNGKVKGTKDSKIEGILDRVALLEMSSHTEVALNKTCENNINFVDAIRDNKVILIEIPEKQFPSQMLRNIMATFYLSKVWLSKIILDSEDYQPTTELLFDEFYKCPNCQLLFEIIFAEARKYRLISSVAIHSLSQLSSKCRITLKGGGASYMLLAGADLQAFKELRTQFEHFGYDEQTFQDLETYSALCLIKNEDTNYCAFVAKLPA
ncbi:MAG: hypothetical protein ACRCXT_19730 [Paraclostridium sp.]